MEIKDSGNRTLFETGAVRDIQVGKGEPVLLPLRAVVEVSKHCEEGAKKYGRDNIRKGLPQSSFCNSAFRHLVNYINGEQDEPHLRAACWNLLWALEQEITYPELNDLHWNREHRNE